MTTQPTWDDSGQGDLLSLVATGPMSGHADGEWLSFTSALKAVAYNDGAIDPNELRLLVRQHVAPQRIGAFTNRALAQGLVEYTGEWVVSDDTEGRNSGKPCRVMRWTGGAL